MEGVFRCKSWFLNAPSLIIEFYGMLYLTKCDVFGQLKMGCFWLKIVVFGQNGCICANGLYLAKTCCIWVKVLFGQNGYICADGLYLGKMGRIWTINCIWQNGLHLAKCVVFGQMGCVWAKWDQGSDLFCVTTGLSIACVT